jgi:hypothetical protein
VQARRGPVIAVNRQLIKVSGPFLRVGRCSCNGELCAKAIERIAIIKAERVLWLINIMVDGGTRRRVVALNPDCKIRVFVLGLSLFPPPHLSSAMWDRHQIQSTMPDLLLCRNLLPVVRWLLPFGPRVRNAEAVSFGITLRGAAGVRTHHGEIAAAFESVAEPGLEQSKLRALPARFRHGAGTRKQAHASCDAQGPGGNGGPVIFRQEPNDPFGAIADLRHLAHEIAEIADLAPTPGRRLRPQLLLLGSGRPCPDFGRRPARQNKPVTDRPVHNAGELNWFVALIGQQGQHPSSSERTHLVKNRGAAILIKPLEGFQLSLCHRIEKPEPKCLRERR